MDNKIPALNPLAANLWLKKLNGETLSKESESTVNAFLASIPVKIDNAGLIELRDFSNDDVGSSRH